jgi:hypothetical protein
MYPHPLSHLRGSLQDPIFDVASVLAQMRSLESLNTLYLLLREGDGNAQLAVARALAPLGDTAALFWILGIIIKPNENNWYDKKKFVRIVETGLEVFACKVSRDFLSEASILPDGVQYVYTSEDGMAIRVGQEHIDCSRVRQLAKEELRRRLT